MENDVQKLEADISFVREAVERSDRERYRPVGIAVLWATILLVGHVLNDIAPDESIVYWNIGPPVGFLLSFLLGKRAAKSRGVYSRDLARKHVLHWGSIFLAVVPIVYISLSHRLDKAATDQIFALVTGIVLFLGGLHLDRRMLWPGLLLVVGSVAVDFIGPYAWTKIGLCYAGSLIAVALWMKPRDDES